MNDNPASSWTSKIRQLGADARFAYTTIFLLQLKILWGIWQAQDLTGGDTSGYFAQAVDFFQRGKVDIAWSPLYTMFCGLLLHLSNDAFINIILQRLFISLTISVLFLALLRRLLPKELAWFVAVWWVVLPINFNPRYEVHEFAVIPVLCVWLISLCKNKTVARVGTSTAFWLTATLMRNELTVAAFLFTSISIGYEVYAHRKTIHRTLVKALIPYVIAALSVVAIVSGMYSISNTQGKELALDFHIKHTLNVCQVYAYNYQQRHPDLIKDPWSECGELAKKTFGTEDLSLIHAIMVNPKAMLQFFTWNIHLIPNGLEVLLFNVAATGDNPDYSPIRVSFWRATLLGTLVCMLLISGLVLTIVQRQSLWTSYGKERIWCFIAMACVASTSLIVMLTQRPRPSYIFTFGMILMFLSGFSVWRLFRPNLSRESLRSLCAPAMCIVLLTVPWYYLNKLKHSTNWDQYYAEEYHLLKPWSKALTRDNKNVLVQTEYTDGLSAYLYGLGPPRGSFFIRRISDFKTDLDKSSFDEVAKKENIWWLLTDEWSHPEPAFKGFVPGSAPKGWELMAMQKCRFGRLLLFRRKS